MNEDYKIIKEKVEKQTISIEIFWRELLTIFEYNPSV